MTTQPRWEQVDNETADLLSLMVGPEREWEWFTLALGTVAWGDGGLIRPNRLRPTLRGKIAPRRIGAFTNRALAQRLIEPTGEWEVSDDTEGRNGGKPCRVYRLTGGQ